MPAHGAESHSGGSHSAASHSATNHGAPSRPGGGHPAASPGIPAEERRRLLVRLLEEQGDKLLTGTELASRFGVSRQVIVQDMAILRASGLPLVATPRGYLLVRYPHPGGAMVRDVLAVCHSEARTRDELLLLVNAGCHVLDVVVEHPVYGELRGDLRLRTPADVEDFLHRVAAARARLLSSLTGGFHFHTVEAPDLETVARAREGLRELGILREENASPASGGGDPAGGAPQQKGR